MFTLRLFACVACVLISLSAHISAQEVLDEKQCIDAVESGICSISSYDVYVEAKALSLVEEVAAGELVDRQVPVVNVLFSRQVSDSTGRHRFERHDANAQLVKDINHVKIHWRPTPLEDPFEMPIENYAATFRELWMGGDIVQLLKLRECRTYRSDGQLTIECLPDPKSNWYPAFGFRFFFLPRNRMLPRRIEVYHKEMTKPHFTTEVLEFYKVDENLWVPGCVQHSTYDDDGRELQRVELRVDAKRSAWNRELPDELFTKKSVD